MKTPEELAEEQVPRLCKKDSEHGAGIRCFLAGYKAALDQFHEQVLSTVSEGLNQIQYHQPDSKVLLLMLTRLKRK